MPCGFYPQLHLVLTRHDDEEVGFTKTLILQVTKWTWRTWPGDTELVIDRRFTLRSSQWKMNALKNHMLLLKEFFCLTRYVPECSRKHVLSLWLQELTPLVKAYLLSNIWILDLGRCHNRMTSICMANVGMCDGAPLPNSAPASARPPTTATFTQEMDLWVLE